VHEGERWRGAKRAQAAASERSLSLVRYERLWYSKRKARGAVAEVSTRSKELRGRFGRRLHALDTKIYEITKHCADVDVEDSLEKAFITCSKRVVRRKRGACSSQSSSSRATAAERLYSLDCGLSALNTTGSFMASAMLPLSLSLPFMNAWQQRTRFTLDTPLVQRLECVLLPAER
jgi:hypothetical protein